MRFVLLATALFWLNRPLLSQDSSTIAAFGTIRLHVNSVGQLGGTGPAVSENRTGGRMLMRKMSFWVTGLMSNGDTAVIADDIFGSSTHWCEGPAAVTGDARLNRSEWPRILALSRTQIEDHRKNCLNQGYLLPAAIARWPGDFRKNGFPTVLAPFADADLNGVYNPAAGDYPYLPAQQHVWAMGSDSLRKAGLKSAAVPMDMAVLWYHGYGRDTISINTSGLRLTLCNRSGSDAGNLRVSMVGDMQLGSAGNEFIETDVRHRALMSFNGDTKDTFFGTAGPSVAMGWFNVKPGASIYFEPGTDAVKGSPQNATHFYNLARGCWKTGTPLGWGGSGLDPTRPAGFVYSGYSDPAFNRLWTEADAGNTPGRRTALISTDTFSLKSGACKVLDGFITVMPSASDSLSRYAFLERVHRNYNMSDFTLGVARSAPNQTLKMFPNPVLAGSMFRLSLAEGETVEILDQAGRLLVKQPYIAQGISLAKPGVYLVRAADLTARLLVY